jgi:hypothetical protein
MKSLEPVIVVHNCNPSTWEEDAGDCEFETNLSSTVRPSLKK